MKNFLLLIFLSCTCNTCLLGQANGNVYLEGKQFKLNGANFYPMVMNYAVELTKAQGDPWQNSYVTPYVEYGINNGPNGGPLSYFFECNNQTQCYTSLLNDWTYLQSLGFNTIRVAGFYPIFNENNIPFSFKCRESTSLSNYYITINPSDPNDPGLLLVLDQYEQLIQLANSLNLKLIFNTIGRKSDFASVPGPANDEIDYYDAFVDQLSNRIVSNSTLQNTVLALDVWNEPCYHDSSNNKTKEETCEIISRWYNTIKAHGDFPLVTIGTCGSNDVLFYDPSVLKVDFHSLHVYPEWRSFEDKTDPLIQQRAISRVFDELYWFNKTSPYPWILGETGFIASAILPVQSVGGPHGSLSDQVNFAQLIMDATCNSGGSGFSWWAFQDGFYNTVEPASNHFGILERGYSTPTSPGGPEKPVANVFRNYVKPTSVNACGPSPINPSSLQTYNPALTYFNPYQHPPNPNNTIKGYLVDQDGNPIANAYVGGHTFVGYDLLGETIHSYQRIFTNANGYFEMIPTPYLPPLLPNVPFYGKLHTLALTSSGGERKKFSEHFWIDCICTLFMPTSNNPLSFLINRTNYSYYGEFENIFVLSNVTRNIEAKNQLTIKMSAFYPGSFVNVIAMKEVDLRSEFHIQNESTTHIFCKETNIDCNNYNGYAMEFKLKDNSAVSYPIYESFVVLEFNKKQRNLGFKVTPNPTSDYFEIISEHDESIEVKLFTIAGKYVNVFRFIGNSGQINSKELSKGIYILKNVKNNEVKKLVIQ